MTDIKAVRASLNPQDVWVFFDLHGFEMSPHEISNTLGLSPGTSSYSAVDPALNSWSIMSDIITNDVNEHLRYLLSQLEGQENCIQAKWNPCFEVHWQMDCLAPGKALNYDADVVRGIVRCKASLSVKVTEPGTVLKMALAKLAASP
jgi:hypothetical protein